MKNKFITFIFVFLVHISFATHYLSSDISFTHISGLTYGITIRIYNNTYNTTADRCNLIVYFGNGDSILIPRINGPSIACPLTHDGVMLSQYANVKESIYYTTYTYAGPGTYFVSFEDVNRTAGICNIPNSINTGIFMQAEIVINAFLGVNTAPQYTTVPLNYDSVGIINYYNPSVIETEGDSLFYQLIPAAGTGISSFNFPPASTSFSIDGLTGTVTWDKPTIICAYSYDIKITEWRNLGGTRYYIGSTMQDVFNYVSTSAGILNLNNEGSLSVYPSPTPSNITVEFNVTETKNVLIELKNALGQTVKTIDNNFFSNGNNKIEINTDGFQSGLYFVQLHDGNNLTNRKFVKD